ncbi:DUF4446 family protein [Proteiniclasticum sp. SCR006]|uniref:DUF4446 family protein n=1 Tax=Proteiniclasticum aestuarii TaxID=2817862 RepID=A0A939HAM6_9CLOT|nr:DUF4446 family protein [Proteiniclasticum aestuarii]MBO1265639.1 DUF4446 family protein [Proteiniclasticum aestuarii]
MDYNIVSTYITANLPIIILIMATVFIVMFFLSIALLISNRKLKKRYDLMMKDADKGSLEDMIRSYQRKVDTSYVDTKLAVEEIKLLSNQINHCIQKVGVVRYKAFDDVGSDLSYSVAMLDNKNDGVVITSIFGRNMSTSYAKPISKGTSKYALSEEENYAMNKALGLEKK